MIHNNWIKSHFSINSSNSGLSFLINGKTCNNKYDVSSMVGFRNSFRWFDDRCFIILYASFCPTSIRKVTATS